MRPTLFALAIILIAPGTPAQDPCDLSIPPDAAMEGEPPLTHEYADAFNSGCDHDCDVPLLQPITAPLFCGRSGFFLVEGIENRDTDWFVVVMPASGVLEITGDAEQPCAVFELWPQDCYLVDVAQSVEIGPCAPGTMVITGEPDSPVWLWVGPTIWWVPGGPDLFEFDYVLQLNLPPVAAEAHSWSGVKSLFR